MSRQSTKLMFDFIYYLLPPTISACAVYPQDFLSKVESILLPYMLSRLKVKRKAQLKIAYVCPNSSL